MENRDTIAYKAWVENLREPAPEGAWDAIADQLDIDASWDNISETLDLDDAWQNIEAELPQPVPVAQHAAPVRFPKLFWAAAALILLTLTTPVPETRNDQPVVNLQEAVPKNTEPHITSVDPLEEDGFSRNVQQSDPANREPAARKRSVRGKLMPQLIQPGNFSADSSRESAIADYETPASLLTTYVSAQADTLTLPKELLKDSLQTFIATEKPADTLGNDQQRRAHWQVGIIGLLKNTWLVNPETTNGLKRTSLNDTRLTFSKEFGLILQRSVGGASAMQLEYYFYSGIGQRYYGYINALYQAKDVRLRYQKVQVIYRTRVWRNLNTPALYAAGGVGISRLTLADASVGNESQDITHEYRPWDYGFILGGEAEFNLHKKLILVSGIRTSYGLRNIYAGTNEAPAQFNRTHSASIGFLIGLKYRIN